LAKRLSEKQKERIIALFIKGKTLDFLALEFNSTKLTISRNLKKNLGEGEYKKFLKNSKINKDYIENEKINGSLGNEKNLNKEINLKTNFEETSRDDAQDLFLSETPFMEIAPLDYDIENVPQKDLSSVPISEIKLPNIVYMIVDKNIELQTKYLRDYPDWRFLSQEELSRKTIQIFLDSKNAKKFCNKEQKVIKVPNTEVFKIVAPILLSRGISRIIIEDNLISL
tara:strand:- start:572 stop:1249 length:678 start_codon:yes stop_codon:yes gene_type:complete